MKKGADSKREKEEPSEEWLVTYADAITLLMAFFIVLLSISTIDKKKYEAISQGITDELLHKEKKNPVVILQSDSLLEMSAAVNAMVVSDNLDAAIYTELTPKGLVIDLSSTSFFQSGSAEVKQEMEPVLRKIVAMISRMDYENDLIEVEGHSDDVAIHTQQFASNWELSGARATNVVRFMIANGIEKRNLKASAFADTRPKAPNRAEDGRPLPENRSKNRRVAIFIHKNGRDLE